MHPSSSAHYILHTLTILHKHKTQDEKKRKENKRKRNKSRKITYAKRPPAHGPAAALCAVPLTRLRLCAKGARVKGDGEGCDHAFTGRNALLHFHQPICSRADWILPVFTMLSIAASIPGFRGAWGWGS